MKRWLVILATTVPLWALDPTVSLSQYAKKHWQVEDGLPQNYVTWISQSAEGYLLVGTAGGAARFDGLRFTPLVLDSATGLSREWITLVQPGADGKTVWVATRDVGFYELGKRHWPIRFDNLIIDRHGDPIGLGAGLYRRTGGDMKLLQRGVGPADPSWSGLLELPSGGMLAATSQGLLLFRDLTKAPQSLLPRDAPEGRSLAIAAARRGGYWLGTSTGLYHARLSSERTRTLALTAVAGVVGPVVSIVEDTDGVVWAGTWGFGLWRVIAGRAERVTVLHGLDDNFVHALFEDRERNLWIGTRTGLSRWKSTPIVPFGLTEGVNGQFVSTVSGDSQGNIWLGTWRSGLYRFRGMTPQRVALPDPDLKVLVRSTATAPDGTLWLSDWVGLFRQEGPRWRRFDGTALGYRPQVHAMFFDRKGRLWTGTEDGLFCHATSTPMVHGTPRITGHSIRAMMEDSRGRIWAGGKDGLWRVEGEAAPVRIEGLPNPAVTSMSEDGAGRVWVTTKANGLVLIHDAGVAVLDQRQGLPAVPLYAAVDDGRGSLWVSSPAGVFELQMPLLNALIAGQRTRIPVISYGQEDGMRTIECQSAGHPSAWKDKDGDIWFPTVRGAIRIRPRTTRVPPPPTVVIESTQTAQRSHSVRFTAARLAAPSRVEFRYRMGQTRADWTYLGAERTLRYDSLPAGTHTLQVAARERGGEWSEPTEVSLTQPPMIYETWWFRLSVVAMLLGVLAVLYRRRVYILRGRYSAVLVERNRIAREWHDTLLAGFSAISWQLDVTLKRLKEKPETAADTVEVARTMVHHYRAEARRVIWDLRHETPDQQSLASAISSTLNEMTNEREIRWDVAVEGHALPVPGKMAQNLLRICQESVANAIRHGEPGRIDVTLKYEDNAVAVTVRDDGRGFDPRSVAPGHFGLQIMQERARHFGGELHVLSSADMGTTVTAVIPLNEPAA